MILDLILHTGDLSNPAKPFIVYKKMVDLLFEEFFAQGDLEKIKGIPITLNCDRTTVSINKAQISFINFIVRPTFNILETIAPEIKPYQNNLTLNLKLYEEKYDEELNLKGKLSI